MANRLLPTHRKPHLIAFQARISLKYLHLTSFKRLIETKATVEYHDVNLGTKNTLDFQLSSHLGYLIGICPEPQNEHFYIVSKDNRFQVLQQYWHHIKTSVSIIPQISEANSKGERCDE